MAHESPGTQVPKSANRTKQTSPQTKALSTGW
jgi:hypothetical protein